MRVTIMGAGALGSYFGARLAAAGHEVAFIARGAHLEAMQLRGVKILSPLGDLELTAVRAFSDPREAGETDAVLFMVKNYDVESAGDRLAPVLAPDAVVVTVQNGISAHRRLAQRIGAARVAPGMVYMPADVTAPGVVRHSSDFSRLVLGPLMDGRSAPLDGLCEAVAGAGIDVRRVADAEPALWEKFALLSAMAAITCLTRLDLGPIRDCPETRSLLRAALDETMAVGMAACAGLTAEAGDRAWQVIEAMRDDVHASMLDDLQRGKRLELDDICGVIVRLGHKHGVPTPIHALADAALRPYVNGQPE